MKAYKSLAPLAINVLQVRITQKILPSIVGIFKVLFYLIIIIIKKNFLFFSPVYLICFIIVNYVNSNLNYWSSGWIGKNKKCECLPITIRCYRTAFDHSNSRKNVWLPNNFMVRNFAFILQSVYTYIFHILFLFL